MERVSQLIQRSLNDLSGKALLLFNPPPDDLYGELTSAGCRVDIWTQDFGDYRRLSATGAPAGFGVLPDRAALPADIILFQPREKDRLEFMLHFLADAMPEGGRLWLAGENQAGIKSAARRLDFFFDDPVKIDSARHCVLYRAGQAKPPEHFLLEKYQQKWLLGSPPDELRMVSLPGVFAHGRLDRGTELLLSMLAGLRGRERPGGTVLDFGCGIGVIGLSLLKRDPAIELTLLDSSALALESARLSATANGLAPRLLPSDGLEQVDGRFDWIVSNPPFHRGIATNYDIARAFFAQSCRLLERQGKLLLVCNRHLPYERWLEEHFGRVENLGKTSHFKVLRANQPKK